MQAKNVQWAMAHEGVGLLFWTPPKKVGVQAGPGRKVGVKVEVKVQSFQFLPTFTPTLTPTFLPWPLLEPLLCWGGQNPTFAVL